MPNTPGVLRYPAALDDADSLIRTKNNYSSKLSAPMGIGDTAATIVNTVPLAGTGIVTIGNEIVSFVANGGGVLSGMVRGLDGTASVAHPTGTTVEVRPASVLFYVLRDGVIALETKLGIGASVPVAGTFLKGTGAGASAWSALTNAEIVGALGYTPLNTAGGVVTGQLLVGPGSSAAPGLAFQGDANTGLSTPTVDELSLVTNGVSRVRIDSLGKVGINQSAPGAMLHAVASGAAVKGLIVQGAISQSANLQEWVKYDGPLYAYVGPNGEFVANRTVTTIAATNAAKPLVVQGAASQSANLTEWQDSSGTVLASISGAASIFAVPNSFTINAGVTYGTGLIRFQNNGTTLAAIGATAGATVFNTGMTVNAGGAGTFGLVVKGQPSQAANLQEWQNSSGTVLSNITSDGRLAVGRTPTGAAFTLSANVAASTAIASLIAHEIAPPVIGSGGTVTAAAYGLIVRKQSGAVIPTSYGIRIDDQGDAATTTYGIYIANQTQSGIAISSQGGQVYFRTGAVGTLGLVVRGEASQTADLTQWQNGSGTVLSAVAADGRMGVGVAPIAGWGLTVGIADNQGILAQGNSTKASGSTYGVYADPNQSVTSSGVMYGIATRTRASAAVAIPAAYGMYVDAPIYGAGAAITTHMGVRIQNQGSAATGTSYGLYLQAQSGASSTTFSIYSAGGQNTLLTGAAATVGLVVQGAASQTANLQEWRDSSNSRMTSVDPAGRMGIMGDPSTAYSLSIGAPTNATQQGVLGIGAFMGATSGIQYGAFIEPIQNVTTTGTLNVLAARARVAASVTLANGVALRALSPTIGAAGAITNQYGVFVDNQGSSLVSNSYGLYIAAQSGSSQAYALQTLGGTVEFWTGFAGVRGPQIRGAASQTADLTQWQDSAGTALSRVDATGRFGIGSAVTAGYDLTVGMDTIGGIFVGGPSAGASGTQYGTVSDPQQTVTNSGTLIGAWSRVRTSAAAITLATGRAFYAASPVVGAGSAITNQRGVEIANQGAAGIATAYGLYISPQSGAGVNYSIVTDGGTVFHLTGAAGVVGQIVRGAASQTAKLQEWQNSSGSVMASVDPLGTYTLNGVTWTDTVGTRRGMYVSGTFNPGVGVDSAAVVFGSVTSITTAVGYTGNVTGSLRGSSVVAIHAGTGTMSAVYGATVDVIQQSTGGVVSAFTGILSRPTVNATVGNANGLSVALTVGASGVLTTGAGITVLGPTITAGGAVGTNYGVYLNNQGAAGVSFSYGLYLVAQAGATTSYAIFSAGGTNRFDSGAVSVVPLVLRGITSQTASLQEWQNSAGTAKASVRADGLINAATVGVATKQKAGTPTDADWTVAPPDGTIVIDSTGSKIWARVGGVWKSATLA